MKIEKTTEGVSLNLSNEEFEKIREEMAYHGLLKDKKKKGLPSIGERYWVLNIVGIGELAFNNIETDKRAISRGNFYITEEGAKKSRRTTSRSRTYSEVHPR